MEALKVKRVKELYQLLCNKTHKRLEPCLDLFKIDENGGLFYEGKSVVKRNAELRKIGVIADRLGIRGLRELGFNIDRTNLKAQFIPDLMEKQIELPSTSDIAKVDDIELDKIMENAARRTEDLTAQFETASQFGETLPMHELLGLDKLRSIRGALKLETAKKVQLEQHLAREEHKLEEVLIS